MNTRLNRPDPFRLDGRVALVTEAAGHPGRAVALELAAAGATVLAAGRDPSRLATLCADIEAGGARTIAIPVGSAEPQAFTHFLDGFAAAGGRLDILVAIEQPARRKAGAALSRQDFIAAVTAAVIRPFELARAATPLLEKAATIAGQSSVIVIPAPVGAGGPQTGRGNRTATEGPHLRAARAGMQELARHMARSLGAQGIRVNAVVPGAVLTPALEAAWLAFAEALKEKVPLGRLGTAEDIAHAVRFLASDAAGYISGAFLAVDGGRGACNAA